MSVSAILATERVPTGQLQPHPQNVRIGDRERIKESLLEHGQYRTIVANKRNNYILAGNHTFMVAKDDLGWEFVDVNWVEADEMQEKKILLVDNSTNDRATYDDPALANMLEEMMLAGQLKGTGYNPDDVDDLLSKMDALPEADEQEVTAKHAESAEDTAARYKPEALKPMRQFVLMYPEDEAAEIETNIKALQKAWGVNRARDVVAEALRRAIEAELSKPAKPEPEA